VNFLRTQKNIRNKTHIGEQPSFKINLCPQKKTRNPYGNPASETSAFIFDFKKKSYWGQKGEIS